MRGLFLLLALVALAQAGVLRAAPVPCPGLPQGLSLEPVGVRLDIPDRNNPVTARIAGTLVETPGVGDEQLRNIPRSSLCLAAFGQVYIDGRDLCSAFGSGFESGDEIRRDGGRIGFKIGTRLRRADLVFRLAAAPTPERCAPVATFTIRTTGNLRMRIAPLLADRMEGRVMTWTERNWGQGSTLDLTMVLGDGSEATAGAADEQADAEPLSAPRSWASFGRGQMAAVLAALFGVLIYVAVVVAGFMAFGGGLLYSRAEPPLATLTRALTATISLYVAARWAIVARDAALLLMSGETQGWTAGLYRTLSAGFDYPTGTLIAAACLLAPVTALFWLCRLAAGRQRPAATLIRHGFRLALHGLAIGSTIAFLFLVAMAAASLLLPAAIPYEPLALLVSLGVAGWAVAPFRNAGGFGRRGAVLLAFAVALVFLYPFAVVRGTREPTAVENALVWFPYIGSYYVPSAMLLTIALLAALKIARSRHRSSEEHEADRALLFLFGLAVTFRAIVDLGSAILFLLVVAIGERLIFPPRRRGMGFKQPVKAKAAGPAAAGAMLDPPLQLAVAVGAVATIIFWLQYSGDLVAGNGPPSLLVPAMLTYAAAAPAAIGALLLSHSYSRLPTSIGATKALVITLFAFAAMAATRLGTIIAERSILPAVTDLLGLFTALVGMAILGYDWRRARVELKGETLKERLAGSGFGWLITILSSASLATVSAVSPVFFKQLGESFQTMVKEIQHKPAAAPESAAPGSRSSSSASADD